MARVGILSDYADVTVLVDRLLTPGHELIHLEHPLRPTVPLDEVPDVLIVPVFRRPHAFDRPIKTFREDVAGGHLLEDIWKVMDGHQRPVIIFGIGVTHKDVPPHIRYHAFLTFPQAIQELNPLISALVGPAAKSGRSH
jgi:hypothetical protein